MKKIKTIKTYYVLDENDKKQIKKQMIDLDLTLSKIAKNLNISIAYICSIINGQRRVTDKIMEQLKSQGIIIKMESNNESNND